MCVQVTIKSETMADLDSFFAKKDKKKGKKVKKFTTNEEIAKNLENPEKKIEKTSSSSISDYKKEEAFASLLAEPITDPLVVTDTTDAAALSSESEPVKDKEAKVRIYFVKYFASCLNIKALVS